MLTKPLLSVLSAGVIAVLLNLILPDNEVVPKDRAPEPGEDVDVEAQPVTEHHMNKDDAESLSSGGEKRVKDGSE